MAYYSDSQTEKILTELEKNIYSMYNVAYTEMKATAKDYLDKYKERYKKEYEAYKNGAYTDSEFKAWVQTQLARGDGYEKMADKMAKRMVEADKVASAYINDATPSIYSLNYNYEAYKISQTKGVDFQLADEQTVKELANDNNHIEFKTTSINPKRDYEWNSKKIQSALNSGILQGKSIDKLADGFYSVMKSDRASAIRNARTSFTSAQNAGRMASYEKATEMGINLEKEWISTKDARTRDTHGALDGVRIPYSEAFSNGLMYPADPEGEPCEVYNCRCTMRAVLPNINDKPRETYKDWLERQKPEEEVKENKTDNILKFAPAKTKEEATEYAILNFADKVDYGKISLDKINVINEELTELFNKYPINKLEEIGTQTKDVCMSANYRHLYINPKNIGKVLEENHDRFISSQEYAKSSLDLLKERYSGKKIPFAIESNIAKLENQLKYSRMGVIDTSNNKLKTCVIHEYGHILADQYIGQINKERANANWNLNYSLRYVGEQIEKIRNESIKNGDIYKISEYSAKNSHEFFAECFAMQEIGEKLPSNVAPIIEEVIKNGIM